MFFIKSDIHITDIYIVSMNEDEYVFQDEN